MGPSARLLCPFLPQLQSPAAVFMVTSGSCPVHFRCPSPAARSFLSSYTWLSGCHCSEYLPSRRPLLCSPFIPSGFAGPRPTLGSVGRSVFSLCPTRPPLFPGKGALPRAGSENTGCSGTSLAKGEPDPAEKRTGQRWPLPATTGLACSLGLLFSRRGTV